VRSLYKAISELARTVRTLSIKEMHVVSYDPNTTVYIQTVFSQLIEANTKLQFAVAATAAGGDANRKAEERTNEKFHDVGDASANEEQQHDHNVGRQSDSDETDNDDSEGDFDDVRDSPREEYCADARRRDVETSITTDAADPETRYHSFPVAASGKNVAEIGVELSTDGREFASLPDDGKSYDRYSMDID
jgi:hypothetical protein